MELSAKENIIVIRFRKLVRKLIFRKRECRRYGQPHEVYRK